MSHLNLTLPQKSEQFSMKIFLKGSDKDILKSNYINTFTTGNKINSHVFGLQIILCQNPIILFWDSIKIIVINIFFIFKYTCHFNLHKKWIRKYYISFIIEKTKTWNPNELPKATELLKRKIRFWYRFFALLCWFIRGPAYLPLVFIPFSVVFIHGL